MSFSKTKPCILFFFISFWLVSFAPVYGQSMTYPLQSTTQFIPPYTPYTPAFFRDIPLKLRVTLQNLDMQKGQVEVFLRMNITSSMFILQTPPYVYTKSILLMPGMATTLTGRDFEEFFFDSNLQISGNAAQYRRTKMLPDGWYQIRFDVIDRKTGKQLNNPRMGMAQAMLSAGQPPILNLPKNGVAIPDTPVPYIFFSWTPRHMSSVAAAYGTEYEFTLVEIYDKQVDANNAFLYSRPLYTETTRSTSFVHTAAHPPLMPGMRYAWRVQAKARDGIEDAHVFHNDGISPVSWFDYTMNCPMVLQFGALTEGDKTTITWSPVAAMEYRVEYRTKGNINFLTAPTMGLSAPLYGLKEGKTYEYRIGVRCNPTDAFLFTDSKMFTVPKRPKGVEDPNCGIMPDVSLTNKKPAPDLLQGLPILVGDFPVFVTSYTNHGNGLFSGEGYVGIPMLQGAKVAIVFSNILVNTEQRMVKGVMSTKYDLQNSMLADIDKVVSGGSGVGDIRTGEEKAAYQVDYTLNPDMPILIVKNDTIQDLIAESGSKELKSGENAIYTLVITDEKGETHKIAANELPATVQDASGTTYQIDEQGKAVALSTNSTIQLDPSTLKTLRSDLATIAFEATPETRYAFDPYQKIYDKVTEYYVKYRPNIGDLIADTKLIPPGQTDVLKATLSNTKAGFDPTKVHFVTGTNKEIASKAEGTSYTLTLTGGKAGDGQEIYALYEESNGTYATLGKLDVYSYEPRTAKVTLVPVNGFSTNINTSEVQAIFGKVDISVELSKAESFDYEPLKAKAFDVTGSGLFSTQTDDMKALNAAYSVALGDSYDPNTAYLFMIENVTGAEGVAGDMPRGKQFGYLFPNADARTVAHELAHGIFSLEHPFSRVSSKNFDKGDLAHALMDYGSGTEFTKYDWDALAASPKVLALFERDKDAMSIATSNRIVLQLLHEIRRSIQGDLTLTGLRSGYGATTESKGISIGGKDYPSISIAEKGSGELDLKGVKPGYNYYNSKYSLLFGNKILITVNTEEERKALETYLYSPLGNTTLLFVNGYRQNIGTTENPDSNNELTKFDMLSYWETIDGEFIDRLKPSKVYYADGHHSVATSNHLSVSSFLGQWVTFTKDPVRQRIEKLHTTPNVAGFNQRRANGKIVGKKLLEEMKKNDETKPLDIVCHSMGYAYALGIVDVLKGNIPLGRFYILAPENPSSGAVSPSDWEEVWQYGSNEVTLSEKRWLQDGVAPQCKVTDLEETTVSGRAYYPEDGSYPMGFVDSHSIGNYGWVFTRTETDKGYVKPRE